MKHGKLINKNSGVEIPCTLSGKPGGGGRILVRIDGTPDDSTYTNLFLVEDGWRFEEDLPKLPTAPGLYQDVSRGSAIEHAVTYRHTHGWYDAARMSQGPLRGEDLASLRRIHAAGNLVRLVREGA